MTRKRQHYTLITHLAVKIFLVVILINKERE